MSDEKALVPAVKQFLSDLVAGREDVITLGESHGLDEARLAKWIDDPPNAQCLEALCKLADMQTQLTISRYRSVAAARLAQIASDEGEKSEIARRASVDLLKLDLKRAENQVQEETLDIVVPSPQALYGIDLRLGADEIVPEDSHTALTGLKHSDSGMEEQL